jgi:uncharacterized heparinase superfamily protein
MKGVTPSERIKLALLTAGDTVRLVHANIAYALRQSIPFSSSTQDRLLIAPQDLRTADATAAADIYSGHLIFAGQVAETNGLSPYIIHPPSAAWAEALHAFGWLRHLRASQLEVARSNARALIDEWIQLKGGEHDEAFLPDVTARRVLAWLAHSAFVLNGADRQFYKRFMGALMRDVRRLISFRHAVCDGVPKLRVAIAISSAGICFGKQSMMLRTGIKMLEKELEEQILSDGGHISRNPMALVDILLDLLPLRQSFLSRDVSPPAVISRCIDRMMPMLRFFRHEDGAFCRFHGNGATRRDLLATVLAYDDAHGTPVSNAPYSGYQRLQAEGTVLIMDVGTLPSASLSRMSHASCLAFELSSGGHRLVTNCGVPPVSRTDWRHMARSTAAHSTLVLNDASSCRFAPDDYEPVLKSACYGVPVLSGPVSVRVKREDTDEKIMLSASHDGYVKPFHMIHERSIAFSRQGTSVTGVDRLRPSGSARKDQKHHYDVRFHLHPDVSVAYQDDDIILTAGQEVWAFQAPGYDIALEDSIFFSDLHGQRASSQIVIHGETSTRDTIAWRFMRRARVKS